jgi:hypothetical protein
MALNLYIVCTLAIHASALRVQEKMMSQIVTVTSINLCDVM